MDVAFTKGDKGLQT